MYRQTTSEPAFVKFSGMKPYSKLNSCLIMLNLQKHRRDIVTVIFKIYLGEKMYNWKLLYHAGVFEGLT